jgi:hypothetical protein
MGAEVRDYVQRLQAEFLQANPDHPQAERLLREYRGRDEGNGA